MEFPFADAPFSGLGWYVRRLSGVTEGPIPCRATQARSSCLVHWGVWRIESVLPRDLIANPTALFPIWAISRLHVTLIYTRIDVPYPIR
jgi:hypothetical protein